MTQRTDLVIEECSQEILSKYNITSETITTNAVDAYWDDPGFNYIIPFDKNKSKYKHNSLFAELIRQFQGQYTQHSLKNLENISKSKHPNTKSFLCFKKRSIGNININSNCNSKNTNTSYSDYDYVGTISICEPVPLVDELTGHDDIESWYPYKQLILDSLRLYQLNGFLVLLSNIRVTLNVACVLYNITKYYFQTGFWFVELVNINPKYQKQGIGSWFLQNIFKNYIKNDFAVIITGKEINAKQFYQRKNGCKIIQQLKLDATWNESNEKLTPSFYFNIWHKDKQKLTLLAKKMKNEMGFVAQYHSIIKCLQLLMFPDSLQWIPMDKIALVLFLIVAIWLTINYLAPSV